MVSHRSTTRIKSYVTKCGFIEHTAARLLLSG